MFSVSFFGLLTLARRRVGPLYALVCCLRHIQAGEPGACLARGLDDLRRVDEALLHDHEGGVVHVGAAVVGAAADRPALARRKTIVQTSSADLVGAEHNLELVDLEEFLNDVRSIHADVVLLERVAHRVRHDAHRVFVGRGVGPKQVHCRLLHFTVDLAEGDLKWTLNLLNVFDFLNGRADTCVNAEDFVVGAAVVNDAGERHVLKHVIQAVEHTRSVIYVFVEAALTLLTQAQVAVDVAVFVVSSQHEDLLGVLELQSHQKANDLQALATLVDVVAQEQVVKTIDIAVLARGSPNVEETHQVNVVAVDVTKNFDWWLKTTDNSRLLLKDILALTNQLQDLLSLEREVTHGLDVVLAFFGLEQL